MPAQSKSSLKVFLRNHKREEPVLVWQLIGNHGIKWSAAQVAWSGAKGIQVRTETNLLFIAINVENFNSLVVPQHHIVMFHNHDLQDRSPLVG